MELTTGKFEGIAHISNSRGLFMMVATDQRGSLKKMINPENPKAVTDDDLKRTKISLIRCLVGRKSGGRATGVLVDPEYSYEKDFLKQCNIPANVGVLMGIESTGYGGQGEYAPKVGIFGGLTPDEGVRKIKMRGASAVKMLVYHRVDSPTHEHQEAMVRAVGEACVKYDIPFLLEPMSHPIAGGPDKKSDPKGFARIKPDLVISTAAELTKPEYHVDVLKAEFPLDLKYAEELGQDPAEACRELTEASRVPWVVLSAGVDYPEFRENVKYAVQNGASGFLAGRAIWKEGVGRKDIDEFLLTTGVKRLNELSDLVERYATPWYKKYADSIEEIEVVRGE